MAGVGFKATATDRDPVVTWAGEGQDREAGQEGEGARGKSRGRMRARRASGWF